ncbi:hypothetical protein PsorP6_007455 [Peronosclerospora sorghi]|uniref:Uncharacterized protein n=1 Tax=Peronosclerospora sorghi TaxID=230839 RepID=A0ACC0WA19_9STRA|nr:hypothetical protein PsorP6_007455 [Peronosclerospora sorghi]
MVDLFLMVFAPGIYFDPVKIAMLIPGGLPNERLRTHSCYGVILISNASPKPMQYQSSSTIPALLRTYLLLKRTLNDELVYIHFVYAPDERSERGESFRALLTTTTITTYNLVMGDFNVTLDCHLDQKLPGVHHPSTGRTELRDWLDKLRLIDSWRFMNPDTRDFTIPKRKNRLDCCFLTPEFLQHRLESVRHVRDTKWHNEDHIAVEFRLKAKI